MRRKKGEAVPVSIWMDRDVAELLNRLSEKAGVSRSHLTTNILRVTLEELEACDKVGVFQVSLLVRNMAEAVKAWSDNVRENPDDFMDFVMGR